MSDEFPPDLDALIAAAGNHTLLFENDKVRVLDTLIKPGETTPVHTHENPSVFYIKNWSDFIRYDGEGNVIVDTRENAGDPPAVLWGDPLGPHAVENVGEVDLHVVGVEIKK